MLREADARVREAEARAKLAELRLQEQQQEMRPSSHIDVEIQWSPTLCMYVVARGSMAACGDTPEMAMDNFDHMWITGKGRIDLPDDFQSEFD